MNFSVTYLTRRFFYHIYIFFHHWYFDASRVFFHKLVSFLERLDQTIALRVTLKYFFQPLFKDYTFIGRILGIIFRTGRALIGAVVYLLVVAVFMTIYIFWLITPIILILYVLGIR
ncbi:MAG TPA: hypothetical protein VMV71_02025 [Candidatus Paceibacterota bacterium]|nr:hypothetical protein [Candidatus Paceibacterota bacterium]